MTKEYRTTRGKGDPVIPEGAGWRMCGSAGSSYYDSTFLQHITVLFWFWERDVEETKP